MNAASAVSPVDRGPELVGQTVVVIGGSAGIGLETARRAGAEGAKLILTGRSPDRLQRAASDVQALDTKAFDTTDPMLLEQFFNNLPTSIDHTMVTAGRPYFGRLIDLDLAHARRALDEHFSLFIAVARYAADNVKPGGALILMGGTGVRRPSIGLGIASTLAAALPALTADLALELAPVRVNLIAAVFVAASFERNCPFDGLFKRQKSPRSRSTS
jgi:NAD(P)-dependent dehydrogenase (short-subunit alcohol dehydrogenase family)